MSLVTQAPPLSEMLAAWSEHFEDALVRGMLWRLGVAPASPDDDRQLATLLIKALSSRARTIDRVFFDWRGGRDPGANQYPSEPFRSLAAALKGRELAQSHAYWSDPEPCSMQIAEVEAIWSAIAERDDWQPFDDKVNAIRRMGEAMGQDAAG
ncbi:MAG: selenoprotein O, partial [Sphingomicrobium sp.]